jgi:hypothetical protein
VLLNVVAKDSIQCYWVPRGIFAILKAGKAASSDSEKIAGQSVFCSLCANDHLVGAKRINGRRCSGHHHLLLGDEVSSLISVALTINQSLVCINSCQDI